MDPAIRHGYPRPQLRRADWLSLNGAWRFRFDDDGRLGRPDEVAQWPLEITVPFPPEAEASGVGDRGFHKACWYQREFELQPGSDRVILHFGAVDYAARVWVNGHLVATHQGGHTPFQADITQALDPGGRQTVTVRAEDDPHDLTKPRGKQDWQLEPHSIWYPRTTGIWQTVWLERVSPVHIRKIRWTPRLDSFALGIEALVEGDTGADTSLELELRHGERLLARDRYRVVDGEVDRLVVLSDPGIDDFRNELLWSPERPTLLEARLRLWCDGKLVDEVESYTALRSANVLRDRFMLNGRPYVLRMVLDQGYWPESLLAAPSDDALRRDVELAKAMGFNGVRKHQKIEDPRYLYWADRLGLLVWEEMPSAYRFTRTAIERTVQEWSEAIERDYSHPCVIVWVPFNESWGVPELPTVRAHRHAVEALYHLTKTLDQTRAVIGNDGWESSATDIIGIHDYDSNIEHIRQRYGPEVEPEKLFDRRRPGGRVLTLDGYPHRGQPIMLTEFGGITFQARAEAGVKKIWGYTEVTDEETFAQLYEQLLQTVIYTALFSGFCYTQFADTFQEANGLLHADRTPKIPLERIRRITSLSRTYIQGGV
ncbi:glycoside hydrolase family 2 protein [Ramlibacter sp.]|uniref:glycoside hydrolase family 2 protein n=1 Tax=Ramlibacter sp. TaxID=1917967 RepID=UPI002D3BA8B7|nr:glycoside hydrolase family 2 TIM barrel-domain containing protein [Ramlibacter sp.]HYD76099.1 glycoside hydrolase family 2 TIM barrel-domain containing protein [Ramlibacter sp.]